MKSLVAQASRLCRHRLKTCVTGWLEIFARRAKKFRSSDDLHFHQTPFNHPHNFRPRPLPRKKVQSPGVNPIYFLDKSDNYRYDHSVAQRLRTSPRQPGKAAPVRQIILQGGKKGVPYCG
jgi:hypothetical protein